LRNTINVTIHLVKKKSMGGEMSFSPLVRPHRFKSKKNA
jgi:hypothetical protein